MFMYNLLNLHFNRNVYLCVYLLVESLFFLCLHQQYFNTIKNRNTCMCKNLQKLVVSIFKTTMRDFVAYVKQNNNSTS